MTTRNSNIDYSEEDISVAIQKGAALLDEKHPTWFQIIDIDDLYMQEFENCIIGQVAGAVSLLGYSEELDELGVDHNFEPIQYGFDLGSVATDGEWTLLRDGWVAQVERRIEDLEVANGAT